MQCILVGKRKADVDVEVEELNIKSQVVSAAAYASLKVEGQL